MDFAQTESQKELVEAAREAYARKLEPLTADKSPEGVRKLRKAMAEQGLLGLNMPTEYGGLGLPLLDTVMVIQALHACSPATGGLAHRTSTGACGAIEAYGTDEQKEKYLRGISQGDIGISIGITEPEAGSAATAMRTRAEVVGDEVVINGSKQFVSAVDVNDFTVLYCRFGNTGKSADIGAVIVPHDAPGFSRSTGTVNMADELLFELYFDDCRVPKSNILLDGNAFGKLISVYNAERLGSISRMLGSAQAAYEYALEYSKERRQFNREISDFQGIQWMLAEMRVKLDAAQLLTYRAASTAQATGLPDALETSIAKVFTATAAKEICDDAIQIMGANGYTKEYPLAHRYAEVRGGSIYGGTVQIHKNMIAGKILGRSNSQWKKN
ncbi:acyl-CoA dehydrogenase family protein [Thalassospiraceae bacterium LMO-JJ14]|nr:acyl-CoA dehydrogenase family protein [Thalassospiraceae bacterium LMO-JJ14]